MNKAGMSKNINTEYLQALPIVEEATCREWGWLQTGKRSRSRFRGLLILSGGENYHKHFQVWDLQLFVRAVVVWATMKDYLGSVLIWNSESGGGGIPQEVAL